MYRYKSKKAAPQRRFARVKSDYGCVTPFSIERERA